MRLTAHDTAVPAISRRRSQSLLAAASVALLISGCTADQAARSRAAASDTVTTTASKATTTSRQVTSQQAPSVASASASGAGAVTASSASAPLRPTRDQTANGVVRFTPARDGAVAIRVELRGLAPGSVHGLHVHETGDCSAPDASSAGGHFNPGGVAHGSPTSTERHAGDLGNVTADDRGAVNATFSVTGLSFAQGDDSAMGRSVVLHAKPDDLKSQPAGDSGARIACGVIGRDVAAGTVG